MKIIILQEKREVPRHIIILRKVVRILMYISVFGWMLTIPFSMQKVEYSMIPILFCFIPFMFVFLDMSISE